QSVVNVQSLSRLAGPEIDGVCAVQAVSRSRVERGIDEERSAVVAERCCKPPLSVIDTNVKSKRRRSCVRRNTEMKSIRGSANGDAGCGALRLGQFISVRPDVFNFPVAKQHWRVGPDDCEVVEQ